MSDKMLSTVINELERSKGVVFQVRRFTYIAQNVCNKSRMIHGVTFITLTFITLTFMIRLSSLINLSDVKIDGLSTSLSYIDENPVNKQTRRIFFVSMRIRDSQAG